MKKIIILLISAVLCLCMVIPVFAEEELTVASYDAPLLVDDADLLTDDQEESLLAYLQEKSDAANADIVIYTMNALTDATPEEQAQNLYIANNYGRGETYDGAMLLIAMESRDVYVLTCGSVEERINESSVRSTVTPDLSDGYFYSAFQSFASEIERGMNAPLVSFTWIPISLGIGFLISLIITSSMKSTMKSVAMKSDATGYVRSNSLVINQSQDRFLYMHLDRVPRPKQTTSSGGGYRGGGGSHSFGGSGGKF